VRAFAGQEGPILTQGVATPVRGTTPQRRNRDARIRRALRRRISSRGRRAERETRRPRAGRSESMSHAGGPDDPYSIRAYVARVRGRSADPAARSTPAGGGRLSIGATSAGVSRELTRGAPRARIAGGPWCRPPSPAGEEGP